MNDKPDSKIRAQLNGIDSQMKTFDFYFEASLIHKVLSHTDEDITAYKTQYCK